MISRKKFASKLNFEYEVKYSTENSNRVDFEHEIFSNDFTWKSKKIKSNWSNSKNWTIEKQNKVREKKFEHRDIISNVKLWPAKSEVQLKLKKLHKSSWKQWITGGPCNYNKYNKLFHFVHQFVFEISLPHLNKLTQHNSNYTVIILRSFKLKLFFYSDWMNWTRSIRLHSY